MINAYKELSFYYKKKLAFSILCLLIFVLPFGRLFEITWIPIIESGGKLQTLIGICYVSLGVLSGLFVKGVKRYPLVILFFAFILLTIVGNLINVGISDLSDLPKHIIFPFYIILLFSITAGMDITKNKVLFLVLIYFFIIVIISIISILDLTKIININAVNSDISYTNFMGISMPCITGLSSNRTDYAFHIAQALAIFLFLTQLKLNKKISFEYLNLIPIKVKLKINKIFFFKVFLYLSFTVLIINAFLTHQRSILISFLLTTLIFWSFKRLKELKYLFLHIFLILCLVLIVILTGDTFKFDFEEDTSFRLRINAISQTFQSIAGNPFGTGYKVIDDPRYGMMNPHNSYLSIILMSGIHGFILFIIFLLPIIKNFIDEQKSNFSLFLSLILIIWFVGQLFHTTMYSTFGWCFLGIVVSYFSNRKLNQWN